MCSRPYGGACCWIRYDRLIIHTCPYLLQISSPQDTKLPKPDMERGRLESAISLSHHNDINGSSQVGCVHVVVEVFARSDEASTSPAYFAQVVRHGGGAMAAGAEEIFLDLPGSCT